MAIYNRWGDIVKITANCGSHRRYNVYNTLVLANHLQDNRTAFYFSGTLKADGGQPEIAFALGQAKMITLSKDILSKAIEEAL